MEKEEKLSPSNQIEQIWFLQNINFSDFFQAVCQMWMNSFINEDCGCYCGKPFCSTYTMNCFHLKCKKYSTGQTWIL